MNMESHPTVDPSNGRIYVAGGAGDVIVVGLDRDGRSLWGTPFKQVFDFQEGVNYPQRALGGGALSWDGQTYYFQTVSEEGDGRLYAINTADGSLKWSFATHSRGWRFHCLVADRHPRRRGDRRQQRRMNATSRSATRGARASWSTSLTVRLAGRGQQRDAVSGRVAVPAAAHRSSLSAQAAGRGRPTTWRTCSRRSTCRPVPPCRCTRRPGQRAVAMNHAVQIDWELVPVPAVYFSHYAVYRSTAPFTSVAGLTPMASIAKHRNHGSTGMRRRRTARATTMP